MKFETGASPFGVITRKDVEQGKLWSKLKEAIAFSENECAEWQAAVRRQYPSLHLAPSQVNIEVGLAVRTQATGPAEVSHMMTVSWGDTKRMFDTFADGINQALRC